MNEAVVDSHVCRNRHNCRLDTTYINRVKRGSPHPRPRQGYQSSALLHTLVALHGPGMRPAGSAERRGAHSKKAMLWHSQMHSWAAATVHLIRQVDGRRQRCGDALRNDILDDPFAEPFLSCLRLRARRSSSAHACTVGSNVCLYYEMAVALKTTLM